MSPNFACYEAVEAFVSLAAPSFALEVVANCDFDFGLNVTNDNAIDISNLINNTDNLGIDNDFSMGIFPIHVAF